MVMRTPGQYQPDHIVPFQPDSASDIKLLLDCAKATGAFPLGLAARPLNNIPLAYIKSMVFRMFGLQNQPKMAQSIEITVDDDGPGIPPEKREEVFKPFSRLDPSRNTKTGGVGLGLSIARDIVLAHGGRIHLDSAPMGGLRVVMVFPL
jgi:signal transduction histidine kinase